jgi:hypothetical protein
MKSIDIRIALTTLDQKLKSLIKEKGSTEIAKITGCKKQNITEYLRCKRTWSWKKILDIAGRVGL